MARYQVVTDVGVILAYIDAHPVDKAISLIEANKPVVCVTKHMAKVKFMARPLSYDLTLRGKRVKALRERLDGRRRKWLPGWHTSHGPVIQPSIAWLRTRLTGQTDIPATMRQNELTR